MGVNVRWPEGKGGTIREELRGQWVKKSCKNPWPQPPPVDQLATGQHGSRVEAGARLNVLGVSGEARSTGGRT